MRASGVCRGRALGLLCVLGLCPLPAAAEPAAIEFGVLPTLSTRAVIDTYDPLRQFLSERLNRTVTLVTARDYRTYIERTQRGEYRFLVTAPHFARLAETEAGYVPLVRVKRELRSVFVARSESPIRTLGELRGRIVTSPETLAVVTMLGKQLLREHGLTPGRDVTVQPFPSFSSAVLAVYNGEADAAMTAETALTQMPKEVRSAMRIIGASAPVPPVMYMAHPRVARAELDQMLRLLLEFSGDRKYGAAFWRKTGFEGFERLRPAELRRMDPYLADLKRQLAAP